MKKTIFTILLFLFAISVSAQSSYQKSVDEKAKKISAATTVNDYDKLFNEFSGLTRSADPYKYKAYYYAGLAMYKKAELSLSKNSGADERNTNGLAEKFVGGALSLKQDDKESNDLLNLIIEQKNKMGVNAKRN